MTLPARPPATPVVVTGMGVLCSIADDVDGFAVSLREGRCGIRRLDDDGHGGGPRFGAPVSGFTLAGALQALQARAGLPRRLLELAERTARRSPLPVQAATATALQAWESAALHRAPLPPDRIGVVVAGSNLTGGYAERLRPLFARSPAYLPPRFALHYQDSDHVGTLSQILGATGEGFTVGAASASGNLAIIAASRLLECGAVDACLAVGALTELSPMEEQGFRNIGAMAGRDRGAAEPGWPFDQAHSGFVPGQASACLLLESERSALARGVEILAGLGGYDLKLDGNALADPSVAGEARVMAGAMRGAGIGPARVAYVNAHGSASPLGDRTELLALREAFGESSGAPLVNATKGLTGHCLAAAGVVEAVATVVQMRHGFAHPNLRLQRPIDDRCRLVGASAEPAEIGFALSNSFGFGGFNSSILLVGRAAAAT